jgi:hypothetical protein
MVVALRGLRGPAGLESARHQIFGLDKPNTRGPRDLRTSLVADSGQLASRLGEVADEMVERVAAAGAFGSALKEVADGLRQQSAALDLAAQRLSDLDTDRPFRVVFMGRTMAGKSTLFEYFTLGDRSRVGLGQQRVTRDACLRWSEVLGCHIVDTPGVGALDGAEDYDIAFAEIADADLVLWVASDDAAQQDTGRALQQIGALGKPIVVALNCRANLSDPIAWDDFTTDPGLIFDGDKLGNLGPINRYLATMGARHLGAVPLHADAALRSTEAGHDSETAATLLTHSRIGDLVSRLHQERDRTAVYRRLLSVCDYIRGDVLDSAATVQTAVTEITAIHERAEGSRLSFDRQAERSIEDARKTLIAALSEIVGRRERWWEDVDIDSDVTQLWADESKLIAAEITDTLLATHASLVAELAAIQSDVSEDWAAFKPGTFSDLTGYGEAWAHRASQLARQTAPWLSVGGAGAGIGFLVGGPVGAGIGFTVGSIVGGALELIGPVRDFLDGLFKLFKSKAEITRERREQVRTQLRPVIVNVREELVTRIHSTVDEWRSAVDQELQAQAQSSAVIGEVARRLADLAVEVRGHFARIDLTTAAHLLSAAGRTRIADAAVRATREQGVAIVLELPEPAYTEQILFPLRPGDSIVPVPNAGRSQAAHALAIIQGLTTGGITVERFSESALQVDLEEPLLGGIRDVWTSLIRRHTGIAPVINCRGSR